MAIATLSRMPPVPPGYVLLTEAAERHKVTRRTLERWIKEDDLKAIHVPGIRQWLISEAELRRVFQPEP